MKKKLSIGIIGVGSIYSRHEQAIKSNKELQLIAVCDSREKITRSIALKNKIRYYTNYQDLIKDKEIDVVAVCVPNGLHFPVGMDIAKHKKHCVMEKPIALNYEDADKLMSSFQRAGKKLFPVLQVRYNPAIVVLKKYVDKNSLGKIFSASLVIRWMRPTEYFSKSPWKGSKKMDGGALLTQAIHYIDVMQHILGPVKSVFGKVKRVMHSIETEDTVNAMINFDSGACANFEFTICAYPHNLECSLTVLGEKGTIKIGGPAMNICELWKVKNIPKPKIPKGLGPNDYEGGAYVGSCPNHKYVYENVSNVLLHNKPSQMSQEDATEAIKIIDAMKKSSRLNKEVIL